MKYFDAIKLFFENLKENSYLFLDIIFYISDYCYFIKIPSSFIIISAKTVLNDAMVHDECQSLKLHLMIYRI